MLELARECGLGEDQLRELLGSGGAIPEDLILIFKKIADKTVEVLPSDREGSGE